MNRLHLVDLDGTLNTIDIEAALEGRECPEVAAYIHGAARFVSDRTGLEEEEVFEGLKDALQALLPQVVEELLGLGHELGADPGEELAGLVQDEAHAF